MSSDDTTEIDLLPPELLQKFLVILGSYLNIIALLLDVTVLLDNRILHLNSTVKLIKNI